jgi:hypothetical protein
MIGPGGVQVRDIVKAIKPISASDGWAVSYGNLLRYDGRWWRPQIALGATTQLEALSVVSPNEIWVAGSEADRQPPYTSRVLIGRLDPRINQINPVVISGSDPSSGQLAGNLRDLAAVPGAVLAIGGRPSDIAYWERPLVLSFDGNQWRDTTPPEWQYGYLNKLSMVSPSEGWATGVLGRPGGQGADAVHPAIVHYRAGQWTEEALPALPISSQPFSMGQIVMRDAGEGWAVFQDAGTVCAHAKLLHFHGGTWVLQDHENASSIALGLVPGTNRGWISLGGCDRGEQPNVDRRMRFDDGAMTLDTAGAQLVPHLYALLSDDLQWAAAGGAMVRYTNEGLPTDRIGKAAAGARFFAESGHSLAGAFRSYYESHGLELGDRGVTPRESLALFGYPISEPFDEINPDTGLLYRVQYFERARMELHPENPAAYRVLLGRLSASALLVRGSNPGPLLGSPPAGCQQFVETGRTLCPPLRAFWQRGGLAVFGLPLTDARDEQSATDVKTYQTQWFERERMEYHPELRGSPYEVLLGLMGSENLRLRGYLG